MIYSDVIYCRSHYSITEGVVIIPLVTVHYSISEGVVIADRIIPLLKEL